MSEKGLYSPVVRRIVTAALLIGITGTFLAVYYLIYLPQQQQQYNVKTFRVLHEIANNFKVRIDNYGTAYITNFVSQSNEDSVLRENTLDHLNLYDSAEKTAFDHLFRSSFKGDASAGKFFSATQTITHDSVLYRVIKIKDPASEHFYKKTKNSIPDTTTLVKLLSDILDPLISIHADVFESFILIKKKGNDVNTGVKNGGSHDTILYESDKLNIAAINTDSLFANKNIEAPVINDITIENIAGKMFLLPFKMKSDPSETYVLAGLLSNNMYRQQSQSLPVDLLLSLCLVLIVLLLALPFLKIFFLSAQENIKISDVRAIITVIFIIPFFIILLCAGILLALYGDKLTTSILSSLQNNIQENFYKEISQTIRQVKQYDDIIQKPSAHLNSGIINSIRSFNRFCKDSLQVNDSARIKDVLFYPDYYKNMTSLHWMDANGNDIAAWNFNKLPATYFKLTDRQYFRDIKYNRVLSDSLWSDTANDFSLQPVLSRLTGEYTINIAMRSKASVANNKKAIAVGISCKMYSVYNTIVPNGFAYCIINEQGDIVNHSDTARCLQENIFEACSDSFALRSIISHKDSVLLPDFTLYDQPVKLMIKPIPGLPYYLITYYNKRGEYLFLFHIMAFVFVCEATLLLFVSLFSYFMMLSNKKHSKLLFSPATLEWLTPSADKKNYYIKNCIQLLACFFLILIVSLFFVGNDNFYLYILNAALLLPLFVITGYYIVKSGRIFLRKEEVAGLLISKKQYGHFLRSILHILLLYVFSVIIFWILKDVLFFDAACNNTNVASGLFFLIIAQPLLVSSIASLNFDYNKTNFSPAKSNGYLLHFIGSVLLAVLLISVMPALIFIGYAFREEKTLQLQSLQIDLAKKIQQRRININPKSWQTKLNAYPFKNDDNAFINELKFNKEKGIYLPGNNDKLDTLTYFLSPVNTGINCAPFYKKITNYLFLPPDHDEFFDDATHDQYYFWTKLFNKNGNDELQLHYKNTSDNKTPCSFSLTSVLPHSLLFDGSAANYLVWLVWLGVIVFFLLFCNVIYATVKRIFLIGFFGITTDASLTNKPDAALRKELNQDSNLKAVLKEMLQTKEELRFKLIREKENEKMNEEAGDDYIIHFHLALMNVYEEIWRNCTEAQKYTLYDFATDGITNYKKVLILYELQKSGLLVKDGDGNIAFMTQSFRNFLITKETSEEIRRLGEQGKKGSWGTLRTVFYVILIAVSIFIFVSQDEASKRLITIVTSLGALLPAILKLFDKSALGAPTAAKSG